MGVFYFQLAIVIAFFLNNVRCSTTVVKYNEIKYCGRKICIPKCCPENMYVNKKQCGNYKEALDFSNFPIYDENVYDTGTKFKDHFTLEPAKFSNETFQAASYNMNRIFNIYLTTTGTIFLELPNAFSRWTSLKPSNYCLDYILPNKRVKVPEINIWAILEDEDSLESNVYMRYGMLVSCVFMAVVLWVYCLLPELRNLCGLVLMAYVASLLIAFLMLAIIQTFIFTDVECLWLTFTVYFFFMASFCWMNIMSYDIWWTFRGYAKARPIHRRGECFKFCMYSIYGWGVPLGLTAFLGIINEMDLKHVPWFITPQIPDKGCFLEDGQKLVYMYIPMLIMNAFNWMFYLMTAYNVWRLSRGTAVLDSAAAGTPATHRSQRHRFMVYLKLSILMGLNWILEVISSFKPDLVVWYITDAYNILIGVAIFLILVCKRKIFNKLAKKFQGHYRRSPYSKSRSSSTTVSNISQDSPQVSINPKGFA
ncbi:G-protein coupled receptor Mth2-like [Aphomia sociella]